MFFLGRGRRGRRPPPASTPRPPTTWTVHRATMALQHEDTYGAPPVLHRPSTATPAAAPPHLPTEAFRKPKAALAPPVLHRPSTATPGPPHLLSSAPTEAFRKRKTALAPPPSQGVHLPPRSSPSPTSSPSASGRDKMLHETGAAGATALHLPPGLPRPARLGLGNVGNKTKIRANDPVLVDTHLYRHHEMINGEIDNWTCLNFSSMCTEEVKKFCMDLTHMCNDTGMVVNPNPCVEIMSVSPKHVQTALRDVQRRATQKLEQQGKKKQLQLLIVILPEIVGSYEKVKRMCETEIGILSQCCLPKHASCSSKQYLVDVALEMNYKFGGHKTVLQRAFARNATSVSEAPTILSGADVAHCPPGGDIPSPCAYVYVCFCDYKVAMPITPGATTVLEIVQSALMKLKIRACDFFLRLNGRMLDGSLMVNSIPALEGSKIVVHPRMRGGAPVNYSLQYEQLDEIINHNSDKLSYDVPIPCGLRDHKDQDAKATFLCELPRYILHQLLVMVCSERHLNGICYNGQFNLSTILMSSCGHMRFSSLVTPCNYTDEGGEADYQRLLDIALIFVDTDTNRYPLHVKNLLRVLRNAPPDLRRERKFVAFLINHPCLLTFAERLTLYNLVDSFVFKLLNPATSSATTPASASATATATSSATTSVSASATATATSSATTPASASATTTATSSATATATSSATTSATASADISALQAWLSTAGQGWKTIVENLKGTRLHKTYMRGAADPLGDRSVLVSKFLPRLDHGLRVGRNYVGHTRNEVSLEDAEASFSYHLEFILSEVLYGLSRLLTGSNAKDFIDLVSDPRAHRTTVRPFCRWLDPAHCGRCGAQLPRCGRCGAQSPRRWRCGAQSPRCVHCGAQPARCVLCGG